MTDDNATTEDRLDVLQQSIAAPPEPALVHEIIREDGERELGRSIQALTWSGLAAGLSMGFSFLVLGVIRSVLPADPWHSLVDGWGYTIGFLIAVLGRQQLFTESTLTAVLPVLTRRDLASVYAMLRLWIAVLFANMIGTVLFALLLSMPGLFSPEISETLTAVAMEAGRDPFWPMLVKAVLAGWLIALMVWMLPGAGPGRLMLILVITYVVAILHLSHLVAGSVEASFLVLTGKASVGHYLQDFFLPTFIGNTLGGVSLVALLNHAPRSRRAEAKQVAVRGRPRSGTAQAAAWRRQRDP